MCQPATMPAAILSISICSCLSWSIVCHVSACHKASSHLVYFYFQLPILVYSVPCVSLLQCQQPSCLFLCVAAYPGLKCAMCQPVKMPVAILSISICSCLSWSIVCHVSAWHNASSHVVYFYLQLPILVYSVPCVSLPQCQQLSCLFLFAAAYPGL
jgi:hypothetical protein